MHEYNITVNLLIQLTTVYVAAGILYKLTYILNDYLIYSYIIYWMDIAYAN